MEEKWIVVKSDDLPRIYEISSLGRIRSIERYSLFKDRWGNMSSRHVPMKVLKTKKRRGYETIVLRDNEGRRHTFFIHRLVATAFVPNNENKPCVDHINTNKNDNRACNLRWCTHRENSLNPITRIHLSAAMVGNSRASGKKQTEEHVKKRTAQQVGIPRPSDVRRKISEGLRGRKMSDYERVKRSKKVMQSLMDGTIVKIWPSSHAAEDALGIKWTNIAKCANANTTNKTAGGFVWSYISD